MLIFLKHQRRVSFSDLSSMINRVVAAIRAGVKLPTVEVRYENICVDAKCKVVHGKPLPTLWNSLKSNFSYQLISMNTFQFLHFVKISLVMEVVAMRKAVSIWFQVSIRQDKHSQRCQWYHQAFKEKQARIVPESDVDTYMKILGLDICADTVVGNAMRRGISRGQKKGLTTGNVETINPD
ncbi:hypothetical protein IFM89_005478 [Coptis chinensis]|uniref:Uncharacterized protein n=1 Tax=Coptis chinensis TaxID=261450 RepID=A0A835M3V9_9MAGN|nr:hypothetical protein IFM89_005478 [Coptis chinensis]